MKRKKTFSNPMLILLILTLLSACNKPGTNGMPKPDIVFFNNQSYNFSHIKIVHQVGKEIGQLDKKVHGESYKVYEIPNVDPNEKVAIRSDKDPTYYEIDKINKEELP